MTAPQALRAIPVDDRAWLIAALADALSGGAPILPLSGIAPDAPEIEALRETPLPEGTAVVVRTSGSSGVPKAVALSAAALRESAEATHEALGGDGQWLIALPAALISGLQMLVRSAVSGIDPVFAMSGDAQAILDAAAELTHDRSYLSVVPVQLSRLLDLAAADAEAASTLRSFDAVLVGGQAVTLELRRRAHELGVRLRRSYGMTETAGGCVYDGVEIGETRVRIREGEVQLAGPHLAIGYLGDPELTSDRFIIDHDRSGHPVRWYRTGDSGELLGGMLTVTGRLDRVIVSGGVNVSLDEVERVVREQPGWESAVALAVGDPEWGERPTLVVEMQGAEAQGAEPRAPFAAVRAAVGERLGAAAAPEWANEIETLPRLSGGKPDLGAIEAWVATLRESFQQLRKDDRT